MLNRVLESNFKLRKFSMLMENNFSEEYLATPAEFHAANESGI